MANKFKKGDMVAIIAGKDKGKSGLVEHVFPKKNTLIVSGLNIKKKTIKKSQESNGSIQDVPSPISISNVSHYDSKKKVNFKVKFLIDENGQKKRVSKISGKEV